MVFTSSFGRVNHSCRPCGPLLDKADFIQNAEDVADHPSSERYPPVLSSYILDEFFSMSLERPRRYLPMQKDEKI